jgi:hypothetical protein
MWSAGIWSRKVREISENSFEITHRAADIVALEYTVMDLHIGTSASINGAPGVFPGSKAINKPLEVVCPPPGIGGKF